MTHKKIIAVILPLILGFVVLIVILPSQGQVNSTQPRRKVFDANRYPIADFNAEEPADPIERTKLRSRAEKHDKSSWQMNPNMVGDSTTLVDAVDPKLPAFPFSESSLVVVGQITNARAYLSNDKSGVFSSFSVQLKEVLKNSSKFPVTADSQIEVEREGGRVRFPSGKLHLFIVNGQDMPEVLQRYVLFLQDGKSEPVFQIITGYELQSGKVFPLDNLPNPKSQQDANELDFLARVRTAARQP